MKALSITIAVLVIAGAAPSRAADLPPGTYSLTVNAYQGCLSTTGVLIYPGPGRPGTELDFTSGTSPLIINKLPNVPASGLTGWTTTSPASMRFAFLSQYNPPYVYAGTIAFKVRQESEYNWFVTTAINIGDYSCTGTFTLDAIRIGVIP
jgi:hypothetical protein